MGNREYIIVVARDIAWDCMGLHGIARIEQRPIRTGTKLGPASHGAREVWYKAENNVEMVQKNVEVAVRRGRYFPCTC